MIIINGNDKFIPATIQTEVNGKLVNIDILLKNKDDLDITKEINNNEFYIEQGSLQKLGLVLDYDDDGLMIIDGDKYFDEDIISSIEKNVVQITDKKFKHALNPLPNPHAYIQQLDGDFFKQLEFNPDDGTMRMKNNFLISLTLKNAVTRTNIKELDIPLPRSLYTIIYRYHSKIDTNTVTVPLPILAKHLGINVRGEGDKAKANDLMKKLNAFRNVIGVLDNGSFYPLLVFLGYNKNENTITFGSPYMNRVLVELRKSNTVIKKGKEAYIAPHHNFLMHGTIANERNKAAVEIVAVIIALLLQRGEAIKPKITLTAKEVEAAAYRGAKLANRDELSSDKKNNLKTDNECINKKEPPHITKAHKSYRGIIDEIPLLTEALNEAQGYRRKNEILRRAFSNVNELLKTKTDVYRYFKNLTISPVKEITAINKKNIDGKIVEIISKEIVIIAPTVSTLDNVLSFTHEGKDSTF